MSLTLYAHPFSSYCQKVLIALFENATPYDLRLLEFGDAAIMAEFEALWPIKRMPVLVDGDRTVMESSVIIEYLQSHHPGPVQLIPPDPEDALEIQFMDRFFDNYVMTPMQRIVLNAIRPPERRDPQAEEEAGALLDTSYRWLDERMAGHAWACGNDFTMADSAAAPSLFYADWVHPIGESFPNVRAYRARLLARPSFARAVDDARPYRPLFPLGAPDRD